MFRQRVPVVRLAAGDRGTVELERSIRDDASVHNRRAASRPPQLTGVSDGLAVSSLVTAGVVAIGAGIWVGLGEQPLPGIALLGLLVVLAVLSPSGALGGTVLAIPTAFEIHPLVVGSFSLLEIGILASAAGLAARTVLAGWTGIRTAIASVISPVELVLPALLLFPSGLIAFAMMPEVTYRTEALRELRLVIAEPLLFLLCALVLFHERQGRTYVWLCVVVVGTLVGAAATLELVTGSGDVFDGAITRASATYSHPNNLALFIERTLLITIPFALRSPRTASVIWVCIAFQAAGVVATFSRGALIAVVIGTIAALLLLRMRRALLWLGGLSVTGGLALIAIARDRVFDTGGFGSEPTRFAIWRSAFRMALDHPVFGVGPDQFLYQYSRRYIEPAAWPERYTSHPHNLGLDVWLRLGVAGLSCVIGIVTGLVAWSMRSLRSIREDPIATGGMAALVGGLAHGMVDNGFFLPDLAVLTWLAVAFVLTSRSAPRNVPA